MDINWKALESYKVTYRDYKIKIKRDFGQYGFYLIDGMPCTSGYVVVDQGETVNVMPGATWFQTVKDAKRAIDCLIEANNDSNKFWNLYRTDPRDRQLTEVSIALEAERRAHYVDSERMRHVQGQLDQLEAQISRIDQILRGSKDER